jgi:predicted nuclease of predicted toxin-antitoxin system
MRILFDQGAPHPLRHCLSNHDVETCQERGWSEVENGALLELAEREGFDVFVTTDQDLRYQQNLAGRRLAIVVLMSASWPRM